MTDSLFHEPQGSPGNLSLGEADGPSLEHRVQRLEQAVAGLQEKTHVMEERLSESSPDKPQVKVGPAPVEADQVVAGAPPSSPELVGQEPCPPSSSQEPWLLTEARAMVRMFFDWRYRVSFSTYLILVISLTLIGTSHLWFPPSYVPVVGFLFEKAIDVILAFWLYRTLSREARRYLRAKSQGS